MLPTQRNPWLALPLTTVCVLALAGSALFALSPAPDETRTAVDAAFFRLGRLSSYRKHEVFLQPMEWLSAAGPITTEHSRDRVKQTLTADLPRFGRVRVETVRVSSRAAALVVAPGVIAEISRVRATGDTGEIRELLHELAALAAALDMGSLTPTYRPNLPGGVALVHSSEDAREILDHVSAQFGIWHRHDAQVEMCDDDEGFAGPIVFEGRRPGKNGDVLKYVRRPMLDSSDAGYSENAIYLDVASGLPIAEEVCDRLGRVLTRVEYTDFGRPITIDLPACLK